MKKKLAALVFVLLAVFLAILAYDRVVPAATVHAACAQSPQAASVSPSAHTALPLVPAQPVVFIGAGLVSILLGILAISPLLVGDPERT